MEYIIGIILLVIVFLIVSYFVKKKYYTEIDRMEAWKIEVMNRPVLDEVGKIKQLNMSGQAEEYFERWRKTWDEVVTEELPNVEEWLFEAEEYVSKYRFKKANEVIDKIETALTNADKKIDDMVTQLNDLINSESKNVQEILEQQDLYKKMKKNLLAHQHAYGKAAERLEELLKAQMEKFDQFETETLNGNYFTAREIVTQLKKELSGINDKLENIPFLLNECQHQIPAQIREIKDGIHEMKEEGYFLEHIGLDKELDKIAKQIETFIALIENAETEEVAEGIEDIKESLELMYDLLENEVTSKQFVLENSSTIRKSVENVAETNKLLVNEVESVKLSYHLMESDEKMLAEMVEKVEALKKSIALILNDEEQSNSAYSAVKEKLSEILSETAELEKQQESFTEMLQALRKDELEAREKIQDLRKQLQDATRLVTRSNVPGIPSEIDIYFLESREALQNCFRFLEQKPLDMQTVRSALQSAEKTVEHLHKQVIEMIENVYLIEKIIQYGNRYRKYRQDVNQRLKIAEEAFRRFDYQIALEEAAAAVESIETGAIKKIEDLIGDEIEKLKNL